MKFQVSFKVDEVSHQYPLRLPIVVTSFFERLSLTESEFITQWKALEESVYKKIEEIKGFF